MVPIYHPKTNSYSIFDCLKMLASLAADALVIAAVVVAVVVVVALVAVVVAT